MRVGYSMGWDGMVGFFKLHERVGFSLSPL